MLLHHYKTYFLAAALATLSACASLNPVHEGKFIFQGTVKNESGGPVANAWVKVRGWETLTDAQGKWQQVQVVNCGTLAEHMDTYEENDAILVQADGFEPSEEKFIVKHPGWFQSCQAEQTVLFDTVLNAKPLEKQMTRNEAKKITPPQESQNIPWTPQGRKKLKGKTTL